MSRLIDSIMELAEPHNPPVYRAYLERQSPEVLAQKLADLRGSLPKGQIEFWQSFKRNLKPVLL